jgi:hypothetical protein
MTPEKALEEPKQQFLRNLRLRWYKALDYLALFGYVAVVSVSALVADYIIMLAIERTVSAAVAQYTIVSQAFGWFQIGSSFLVLIGAATHAIFSVYSQVRFEVEAAKEPQLKVEVGK